MNPRASRWLEPSILVLAGCVADGDAAEPTRPASVTAPFRIVATSPEPGAHVILPEALVDDRERLVLIDDGVVEVLAGRLRLHEIASQAQGDVIVPMARPLDATTVQDMVGVDWPALVEVDAELEEVLVEGAEGLWSCDGSVAHCESLEPGVRISAAGILWSEGDWLVMPDPSGARPSALEWKHAEGSGGPARPGSLAPPRRYARGSGGDGATCEDTEQCVDGLFCVLPPSESTPTCSLACVDETLEETACTDDDSCCDPAALCDEDTGACVVNGGENTGGGGCACNDRDDDGVVDGWDAKPEESCKADQDGDGCNDSCDNDDTKGPLGCGQSSEDDSSSGFCRLALPRPNATAIGLVVVLFVVGRSARH